ncbi:hypothetical protein FVE85_1728 [Porphyridium purpureum]|uniref:Uncharacterized protein n=1 Tax=Porphyridium purpureum TaxID=35688 RepID=A0A5J4YY71_PORPP|nr:hypothetical protein FVE85_1728 [Porphyridium purpureum]|eukprot:POR1466..scf209_3
MRRLRLRLSACAPHRRRGRNRSDSGKSSASPPGAVRKRLRKPALGFPRPEREDEQILGRREVVGSEDRPRCRLSAPMMASWPRAWLVVLLLGLSGSVSRAGAFRFLLGADSSTAREEQIANLGKLSRAAAYFHGLSRFGVTNNFDTSWDYVQGILYAALPWLVVGSVVAFAGFVMMIVRFTCARKYYDYFDDYWRSRGLKRHLIQGSVSAILSIGIVSFGAISLMENFLISQSLFRFLDYLDNMVDGLQNGAILILNSASFLSDRSIITLANLADRYEGLLSQDAQNKLNTAANILTTLNNRARDLNAALQSFNSQINDVQDLINTASIILYATLGPIIFITMLSSVLALLYATFRNTYTRVIVLLGYLIPMSLAWVMLAATVVLGCGVGDMCSLSQDFTDSILYSLELTDMPPSGQPNWISENLQCPDISQSVQQQIEEATTFIDDNLDIVSLLAATPDDTMSNVARLVRSYLDDLEACDVLLDGLYVFNDVFCDEDSLVQSVLILYICYVIMSFFISFMYFAGLWGMNMAEWSQIWPLWVDVEETDVVSDKLVDPMDYDMYDHGMHSPQAQEFDAVEYENDAYDGYDANQQFEQYDAPNARDDEFQSSHYEPVEPVYEQSTDAMPGYPEPDQSNTGNHWV